MKQRSGFATTLVNQLKIVALMIFLGLGVNLNAQRIMGYFPNYNYTAADATNIQYSRLTHLLYFSLNPVETSYGQSNGNLWFNDTYSWFTTAYFNDVVAKARAANPSIKIDIVTGGAPGSDGGLLARLEYIGSNASLRNRFCNNIINFIVANNLDGWDLDWEFPTTPSARLAHQNMIATMRGKIDSLKLVYCKPYELSIAVGGGYTDVTSPRTCWGMAHNDYLNAATIPYLDYINIMAYDGNIGSPPCSFSSHQHYDLMVKSFNDWRTAFPSLPASKINMGVGFYGNGFVDFNTIGNVGTRYNNATYWPTGGSGCTNMQNKIDYMRTNGMAGIFIWELTQDNLCVGGPTGCYSLLYCINQYVTTTWGTWTPPSNICPMPVKFLDFKGEMNERNEVLLTWNAITDDQHKRFDVERSIDGKNYTKLMSLEGNSSPNGVAEYNYLDRSASAQTIYYRILQYDLDGTSSVSSVVTISAEGDYYELVPNPFENSIRLKGGRSGQEVLVQVTDLSGHTLISRKIISGAEEIELGEDFPTGVFICTITTGTTSTSSRIVKVR